MSFFTWLFGNRDKTEAAPRSDGPGQTTAEAEPRKREPAADVEADNLRRWRESGQPRAWVEARRGKWDHAAWLVLLEELKRSPYWPMRPEAVGLVLEGEKKEWLRRN
jgi:hypothetical protein